MLWLMVLLLSTFGIVAAAPNAAEPSAPKRMDLTSPVTDPNGFLLNPDWYGQSGYRHGSIAVPDIDASVECNYFRNDGGTFILTQQCSSKPLEVDERRPFHGPFLDVIAYACQFSYDKREELDRYSVHGHVNWEVATYTGHVFFDDFQDPVLFHHWPPGDGDLDFTITRDDHAGYVKGTASLDRSGHDPGIVMEVNRYELGALATPWWADFAAQLKDAQNLQRARDKLMGVDGTAIGLVGIDTKHGAHTELHPLFVLFARTNVDNVGEHWVFIARNWGYEGGCSKDLHLLGRDVVNVAITPLASAKLWNLVVSPSAAASWISPQPGEGANAVSVHFPAGVQRPVVIGEFDVCVQRCVSGRF
jgi:hypothetical protein